MITYTSIAVTHGETRAEAHVAERRSTPKIAHIGRFWTCTYGTVAICLRLIQFRQQVKRIARLDTERVSSGEYEYLEQKKKMSLLPELWIIPLIKSTIVGYANLCLSHPPQVLPVRGRSMTNSKVPAPPLPDTLPPQNLDYLKAVVDGIRGE